MVKWIHLRWWRWRRRGRRRRSGLPSQSAAGGMATKCSRAHSSDKMAGRKSEGLPRRLLLELEEEPRQTFSFTSGEGGDEEGGLEGLAGGNGMCGRGLREVGTGWSDHAMSSGEVSQVRLILLEVVQAVDVLYVDLELPEVFR